VKIKLQVKMLEPKPGRRHADVLHDHVTMVFRKGEGCKYCHFEGSCKDEHKMADDFLDNVQIAIEDCAKVGGHA
jgi:hypothetical protein